MSAPAATSPHVVKVSLVDQVADIVRDRVANGELAPGETLHIERLARELGVSRTPVREAISKLEVSGTVVRRPGHAPTVFAARSEDVREYFEMRMELEPLAARLALPHLDGKRIAELAALTKAMDTFDAPNWPSLNRAFHRTLYVAADRPFLVDTIENLIARSEPYIRIYFDNHDLRQTQREHRRILAAVRKRDEVEVTKAIRDHLQQVIAGVLEALEHRSRQLAEDAR